jgi:outer membrane protein assembly factor BamB
MHDRHYRLGVISYTVTLALVVMTAGITALGANDDLTVHYRHAANTILQQPGISEKGHCLVYGGGQGQLAYEVAQRTDMTILSVDSDPNRIHQGRLWLRDSGLYGRRITLHCGDLEQLPYRDYSAGLVVCDSVIASGDLPGNPREMFRMVRPHGGILVIGQPHGCPRKLNRGQLIQWMDRLDHPYQLIDGAQGLWAVLVRRPLPGAGQWTHMWADAANTGCSQEQGIKDDFEVLWFGEPGPRIMVDRHWRPMAPLYKNGRFFVPGDNHLVCLDAYNGARYWDLALPPSARIAIMRDCGWLALADDHLYAAIDSSCHKISVADGQIASVWRLPEQDVDWGYIAYDTDRVFGSLQRQGASRLSINYRDHAQGFLGNQISRKDNQPTVVSQGLFCCDAVDGRRLWTYRANKAVIANPTICIGDEGVYFWESSSPDALSHPQARVAPGVFSQGSHEHLVKLDKSSGRLLWRKQIDLSFQHIFYLSYSKDKLVSSGCSTQQGQYWYHIVTCDAGDGSIAWQKEVSSGFANSDTDHGKQDKRPMIMGNTVCFKFGSFDLATGESRDYRFATSNCAGCSASNTHVFGRNKGVPTMFRYGDANKEGKPLCTAMRPGCYISIIPAGGMILLPSFSAGCTCNYTLETTIGWLPK